MGKKIFFGNYKGGVGKTTSTYNIAVNLSKSFDKRVLLVDLDPQSSLSEVCMTSYGMQLDELTSEQTLNYVYDIYMQSKKIGRINVKLDCKAIIKSTNGVDFIPNSLFYKNGGLDKISMDIGTSIENLLILRDFIEDNDLLSKYDFIFFDCPPSNNIITQSAFLYSDYYIIPTIMDSLSSKGVKHYVTVIEKIYENFCIKNPNSDVLSLIFGAKPELIGIFETMRKANTNTESFRVLLKSSYYVFKNEIKDRKDVASTMGTGEEASSTEYTQLAEEMLERLNEMEESSE